MPKRRRSSRSNVTGPVAIILLLLAGIVLVARAWPRSGEAAPSATITVPQIPNATPLHERATLAAQGDAISIFFSDPLSGFESGGPDQQLIRAVRGASKTVDMAIYNISLEDLANALIEARDRGVLVRLVMESEAMDGRIPRRLVGAGIPVLGDQRDGLMHNKFTIIDGQEVWTGSMNYTASSSYNDFNNLVRLRSQRAAANYTAEFEEMYSENLFGPDARANTPYPSFTINGIPVEVYFSPDDKPSAQVVEEIRAAEISIDFLAYAFTSDPIAEAMLERSRAGVEVRGVFDESQVASNQGGEYEALRRAGLDVRLDGIGGLMHNKVIVIDGQKVITGSYNFSANAERSNDENLIILHDAEIARQYLEAFDRVWGSTK